MAHLKNPSGFSPAYWHKHVVAQKASGLSRAEYCRQHGLSYHAMTYWQRKLGNPSHSTPTLVPVPVEKIISPPVTGQAGVRVILNDTIVIEVAERFSPRVLRQVVRALEGR